MKKEKVIKEWSSKLPETCNICDKPFGKTFIDGATDHGWALMCERCHKIHGFGLGIGYGQKYNTKTKKGISGFNLK